MVKRKDNTRQDSTRNRITNLLAFGLLLGLSFAVPVLAQEDDLVLELEEHYTPQWVERYILEHYPILLKGSQNDHVLAFYYFGSYQNFTVFGMERVKGDDYLSHNTVLIFNDSKLQGYYEELTVFPAGVTEEGRVFFPPNYQAVKNINLEAGDYPTIQFKPDLERFKRGSVEIPPPSFTYTTVQKLKFRL